MCARWSFAWYLGRDNCHDYIMSGLFFLSFKYILANYFSLFRIVVLLLLMLLMPCRCCCWNGFSALNENTQQNCQIQFYCKMPSFYPSIWVDNAEWMTNSIVWGRLTIKCTTQYCTPLCFLTFNDEKVTARTTITTTTKKGPPNEHVV